MDTRRERILESDSPNQTEKFRGTAWAQDILRDIDSEAERTSREGRALKLLVYVHGGLNTYSREMVRTAELAEAARTGKMGGDGEGGGDREVPHLAAYYPLFINWNSDLLESVWDDLFEIQWGERRPYYGYLAAGPAAAKRLASGIMNLPTSIGIEFGTVGSGLKTTLDDEWWRVNSFCAPAADSAPDRGDGWKLWNAMMFTAFLPTRVVSAAVIQGLGAAAWDVMKRRAELVMAPRKQVSKFAPNNVGGGHLFLQLIKSRIADGKWTWVDGQGASRTVKVEVTMMGHSMGTMVINKALTTMPDLRLDRIVYLAAAASIDNVLDAVVPYLAKNEKAEFWSFSLAASKEALEFNGIDALPRGSLLVWIDNFFEKLKAPGDRTFGRALNLHNYVAVPESPEGIGRRFFLVKYGRADGNPSRHAHLAKIGEIERALATVERGECQMPGVKGGDGWAPR